MSLVTDLVAYVDAQTSLTTDVDLFVGAEIIDAPEESVVIREVPGSTENRSGMEMRAIQIVSKGLSYNAAEVLCSTVYNLLKHKPGFPDVSLSSVFYCDVLGRPALLDRDERGSYIFVSNLLIRKG